MSSTKKKNPEKKRWTDPFVAEVRQIRDEHARRFDYDIDAVFEDILKNQKESKRQRKD